MELTLAQADRIVDGDEPVEPDVQRWDRRARTKFAVAGKKDFGEPRGHGKKRVACGTVRSATVDGMVPQPAGGNPELHAEP